MLEIPLRLDAQTISRYDFRGSISVDTFDLKGYSALNQKFRFCT